MPGRVTAVTTQIPNMNQGGQDAYTVVDLDWDFHYEDIENSTSFSILQNWLMANKRFVESVHKRPSADNNAHLRIMLHSPVTPLQLFQIRAILRDDVYRLLNDIIRLAVNEPINRLWEIKNGKHAGEWVKIWPKDGQLDGH